MRGTKFTENFVLVAANGRAVASVVRHPFPAECELTSAGNPAPPAACTPRVEIPVLPRQFTTEGTESTRPCFSVVLPVLWQMLLTWRERTD